MPDDRTAPIPRHVAKSDGWRTSRLRELGYSSYREYLQGDHWKRTRERYWSSATTPKECLCGESSPHRLQLHHMTYLRIGRERLTDLRPLCRQCHNDIHVLAQRNLVRFDLADYDDVRRRIIYALERRRRLQRDGVNPIELSARPYDARTWAADAKLRQMNAKHEIGGKAWRKEQARRLARQRRAI